MDDRNGPTGGEDAIDRLRRMIDEAECVVAFTGAGISTESGIPDFRSPGGIWTKYRPIDFRDFMASEEMRVESWRRKFATDEVMRAAQPNLGHRALAELARRGKLSCVITQNVDGLHQAGGSAHVIELHGRLRDVVCLQCGDVTGRSGVQRRLEALNPGVAPTGGSLAPDGDADIDPHLAASFSVASCERCDGTLKPDVVFFGENVPRERVDRAMDVIDDARALLVLGSSLMVWSGYRFARRAADRGIPIAIVNLGVTRADDLATIKIEARCGDVLTALQQ